MFVRTKWGKSLSILNEQTPTRFSPCGRKRGTEYLKGCLMKKQERLEFRVSLLEKELIKQRAEKCNMSTGEYCRNSALGKRITYSLSDEELQVYKTLVKYHNNFTKIGNLYRKNVDMTQEVRKLLALLKGEIEHIRNGRKSNDSQ